jgi:chromosome segregation ATPase
MTTAPSTAIAPSILRNPAEYIRNNILPTLRDLNDQLGKMDELDKEIAKRRAQLDMLKQNVAGMQINFDEVKREHDKILNAAHEKQAESERLDKEIKEKRVVVSQLDDYVNKIRQKLGPNVVGASLSMLSSPKSSPTPKTFSSA